ncbi:MAG: hypothetical protein Q9187_004211 [Circinaria calcarea]
MKVRRLGEALLRSHPSPLLSFLAPSIPLSLWSSSAAQFPSFLVSTRTPVRLRNLATKSSPLQASSTAAAVLEDDPPEDPNRAPSHDKPEALSSKGDSDSRISDIHGIIDSIGPRRRSEPESNHSSSSANSGMRTSADTIRRAFEGEFPSSNHLKNRQGAIAAQMDGVEGTDSMMGQLLRSEMNSRIALPPLRPPVRLDAFVGRSEEVDPSKGLDLGRALRRMEVKLALNNVRLDFQRQRFHERAGLKRKRLKRFRWRRRFKEGFKAVVAKVQDMRKRGW